MQLSNLVISIFMKWQGYWGWTVYRLLQKKYGLSYLFISHDLKVIQALCHRILVMKDGKVVEEGTSGEIFQNPQTPYTRELLEAVLE